jgi:hypothetical protein
MITIRSRTFVLALAATVAPALVACGGDRERDRAGDVPATTSTPPATANAPAATLRVTDVELGRAIGADRRIPDAAETDDFSPRDTIYAAVNTEGMATGATLVARWTHQDGQVVDETSQTISPTGPAVTEFHIAKPDGFPVGNYRLAILLNGQEVETEDFEVRR